jgi:hypothetical protein
VKLKNRLGLFMFMSGSVQTADHRRVLTVSFGVALVEKTDPAVTPPAPTAQ